MCSFLGSLFEQFATQAKELVKETTRQSSQDGLLAHVDKVRIEHRFLMFALLNAKTCFSFFFPVENTVIVISSANAIDLNVVIQFLSRSLSLLFCVRVPISVYCATNH